MFLVKFFNKKDHRHYLAQANKHLACERYAEARADFQEALQRCPADAAQDGLEIRTGLTRAGDGLGELNLREAEWSLSAGEFAKALDHFKLAGELADDQGIRARAKAGLKRVEEQAETDAPAAPQPKTHGGGSCASCNSAGSHQLPEEEYGGEHLSEEDRFQLMVQPLPGGLGARYASLGPKFARAYLLIHDGKDAEALPVLQEMLGTREDDIVIYEVALIMYRSRRTHECEELLKRSLELNPQNAASYLALVHLLAETQRFSEAIAVLQRMMELDVMADQAQFMLGEIHEATGDEALALEAWTKALEFPGVARSAAERLVPILGEQGRSQEANYLIKRYLKGCC